NELFYSLIHQSNMKQRNGAMSFAKTQNSSGIDITPRAQKTEARGNVSCAQTHECLAQEQRCHSALVLSEITVEIRGRVRIASNLCLSRPSEIDGEEDVARLDELLEVSTRRRVRGLVPSMYVQHSRFAFHRRVGYKQKCWNDDSRFAFVYQLLNAISF